MKIVVIAFSRKFLRKCENHLANVDFSGLRKWQNIVTNVKNKRTVFVKIFSGHDILGRYSLKPGLRSCGPVFIILLYIVCRVILMRKKNLSTSVRTRIQQLNKYGSFPNPDPQPWGKFCVSKCRAFCFCENQNYFCESICENQYIQSIAAKIFEKTEFFVRILRNKNPRLLVKLYGFARAFVFRENAKIRR